MAAAAFSTTPGIQVGPPTNPRLVDLAPDPLLFLSRAASSVFLDLCGVLDAAGTAGAPILVPPIPALRRPASSSRS